MRKLTPLALVLAALAAGTASVARADGDPASDAGKATDAERPRSRESRSPRRAPTT